MVKYYLLLKIYIHLPKDALDKAKFDIIIQTFGNPLRAFSLPLGILIFLMFL